MIAAIRAERDAREVDAFDADVLIYAAVPGHPLGEQVVQHCSGPRLRRRRALARSCCSLRSSAGRCATVPPTRFRILAALLARLDLRPVDRATAELATALSGRYRLKAADATHLATAVGMGADRFITNNKRDFPPAITEVQVTYPADLAGSAASDISTVGGMLAELVRRGAPRCAKPTSRSGRWAMSRPSPSVKVTDPVRST